MGDRSFTVIAVAMDSRRGDPLPWIEAAKPTYPVLIDRDHRLAELYHIVNVPQAVWIDETGRIVRPPEPAGAFEGFRKMNRETREVPDDVAQTPAQAKSTYLDAIRDWVRRGPASAAAFAPDAARSHLPRPTEDSVAAHAMFRLGQHLLRRGDAQEGARWLAEGSRRPPGAWGIVRRPGRLH